MKRKSKKMRREEKRIKIRNRSLCKKYPFIIPWKGWKKDRYGNYREVYGWKRGEEYSYIRWDFWPRGWNKILAPMMLGELGVAVKKTPFPEKFHVVDGKEKWGRLELDFPGTDEMLRIIDKYEVISQNVCVRCGKPDVWVINDGWVYPICFECFEKDYNNTYNKYLAPSAKYSSEEIKRLYDGYHCGDTNLMAESYEIYNVGSVLPKVTEINIKPTVEKIRARWRKK